MLSLVLAGCMGFLEAPEGAVYVDDQVGDAPDEHDIAWARWNPEEPRFELGMADGEVDGSKILATFLGADQEVGVYLMRTDEELRLTYVEDCPDCDFQTVSVVAREHDIEGGKAWTWTHQKDVQLTRDFVVQTIGSDEFGENSCVYDQLATGAYPDSPVCGQGEAWEGPADLPVIDGSTDSQRVEVPPMHDDGCTAATWNDPALFAAAMSLDSGNGSVEHEVEPGLHYLPPSKGLHAATDLAEWPHEVVAMWNGDVILFGIFDGPPWLDITAANEDEARARGKDFLGEASLADPEVFDDWLSSFDITGHSNNDTIYTATVGGEFRLPAALENATLAPDDLRSADLDAGQWHASISLPLYRIKPEHGFIELSPLGEIEASLQPDPSYQEAANEVLAAYGLGPSSFEDFTEFDHFGRGRCGDQTIG